ncbi:hypothetical protein Mp_5g17230 [Marchantia polymorpha subsp. ruderalis]|uniref:Uncharacterized protein n=2 Tax=Marchantia polymorpha TaxID=3197 RepID=A0AAF6BJ99_MARPO|nr:hypothetical protein MARPO_0196s0001 [Marchantia polymorpha]BBN12083.1 hypothetical protein Mp_5g17230 [Marchantia polymorpha subsp. ruderalis]|eukprot:PTQ27489.1 hypothetical protein MARPO_0196s0001 [Marchantia polymorpha]
MENLGLKGLLCLLITWTTVLHVEANFHLVNKRTNSGTSGVSDTLILVPSNNFGCAGVQTIYAAVGQYPSCTGGDIRIPDGQCGWSGVRIRPSCVGTYFGQLFGASGEPQGYCFWSDYGDKISFICGSASFYDRLVCYTDMCG